MKFSKISKNFFSNLAEYLLIKLSKPDKYNLKLIIQFYCSFAITADFVLSALLKNIFSKSCKILKVIKL